VTATTAGFTATVRGRRVYLVEVEPSSDPSLSHHEAKELAQRLLHAAAAAERAGSGPATLGAVTPAGHTRWTHQPGTRGGHTSYP
jgi:hypothetical protein